MKFKKIEKPSSSSLRTNLIDERCRFRPLNVDGKRVVIRLTYSCDLSCPHCLLNTRDKRKEINADDWSQILKELPDIQAKKVLLTGGEPLLYNDLIRIVHDISKKGITVDLNTNLQKMTKGKMKEFGDAGLTEISTSIEGPELIHDRIHGKAGIFAKIINAINWASESGIEVDASCCITRENAAYLSEIFNLMINLPIKSITFTRLLPIGHGTNSRQSISRNNLKEIFKKLISVYIPRSPVPVRLIGILNAPTHADCLRGRSLIGLTPFGDLLGCVLTSDNPDQIPHPLTQGLSNSLKVLQKRLLERKYDLCWSGKETKGVDNGKSDF